MQTTICAPNAPVAAGHSAFSHLAILMAGVVLQVASSSSWAADPTPTTGYTFLAYHSGATSVPATDCRLESLQPWNGRIHSSFSATEDGPAFLAAFDPQSNTFGPAWQAGTKYVDRLKPIGGKLYASSGRNIGPVAGNLFVADAAGTWSTIMFEPKALHIYEVTALGTDIFAFGSGPEGSMPTGVAYRSTDGGATYTISYEHATDPYLSAQEQRNWPQWLTRCYLGGVLNGKLYTQEIQYVPAPVGSEYVEAPYDIYMLPTASARVFDPAVGSWKPAPRMFPASITRARGYAQANFLGKLVYQTAGPYSAAEFLNNDLFTYDGAQATLVTMPSKIKNFIVDGSYLYALGSDSVVRRTADLQNWTVMGTAPAISRSLTVMNGRIYIGGGDAGIYVLGNGQQPPSNQSPVARATPQTFSGTAPATVSFSGAGSTDADGTIASYAWVFGDGTTGSGRTINHTYTNANTYTTTLTVTDNLGAMNAVSMTITVTAPAPGNQAPVARVTASTTTGTAPMAVSFDGSGSTDADGTIASYAWDFGDGTYGSGVSASHTYTAAGTYTARLTVTDNAGATNMKPQMITVTAPPPSASGPMAAWNFDENSGSTAADATGNGHTGTLLSGAAWAAGKTGAAVSFDGANGQVSVPDFDPPTDVTLEAWIYPAQSSGVDRIIINKDNSEYDFRIDERGNLFGQVGNVGLTATAFDVGSAANANRWYHIAYTFNAATDTAKLYRDGVEVASGTNTASISNQATELRIGRHSQFDFGTFAGRIDQVRIFARALSASEVQTDATVQPPQPTGLIARWRLDEGSGTVAADASGNNRTGTLGSGAAWAAGKAGTAASFNGSNGQISVPDFNPPTDLTLEAWIYPGQASGMDRIIINKHNSEYDLRIDTNGNLAGQVGNISLVATGFDFGSAANADRWYHVAYTFDASTKTAKLYRDAVEVASGTNTASISNQATELRIGRHSQFDFGSFLGRIDDVRIYDRALAGSEVSSDSQNPAAGSTVATQVVADAASQASGSPSRGCGLGTGVAMILLALGLASAHRGGHRDRRPQARS
ncbi:MAG: PKD domain-containing protein [Planctomycetes bacterium]|nr:PKD domain-containing protein [Planctomycetota bacterium]